ncbi:bifunctional DNA-formamidopyrimidine glycosylase/DNA-(apurinic or apyrimidinic site) lyase [Candidatus Woesearchaeota archaeon]|nr:bifunctional DNA-formamidopyrimidine glycosylase/DNA-(apurinic or apyrimidinic site) lyase [Candidatus Woesearchaeota archaeon]
MPELPEVETIVNQLNSEINHKTILSIENLDHKVVDKKTSTIKNININNVCRRAKYIIIALNNSQYIVIHLRLTGHFHYFKNKDKFTNEKFCVAKIYFNDNSLLTFHSIRRFERFDILNQSELNTLTAPLGPEPLDKSFTADKFQQLFQKSPSANIKTKLMNQNIIAGIGNIYAQESLYYAGINPQKKIQDIPSEKLTNLYHEIQRILLQAIKHKGTSVDDYEHLNGEGDFQNYLAVYQKSHCPKKHPLKKINISGRGTFYCPICQK